MSIKFNIITEPDFLHNDSKSIMLVNLQSEHRTWFNDWLKNNDQHVNIYIGSEQNTGWNFNVADLADVIIINLDDMPAPLCFFAGIFVRRPKTYYFTNGYINDWKSISNNRIFDFNFLNEVIN